MFDNLVESEPQGSDLNDRRKYFAVSSVAVGILLTTAVVVSIFAADYGLGNGRLDLVEMIAPVAPDPLEPEIREPRPRAASVSSSTSNLPTRRENMARTDESTFVPNAISTTPNTSAARPQYTGFIPGKVDSNPGTPGDTVSGRPDGVGGPIAGGLGDPTRRPDDGGEAEDTTPPPAAIKTPAKPKTTVSKGVLNGSATSLPKPIYPPPAKLVGAQGQVTVQVTIDESGRVISARAVNGHPLLRAESEKAARNARFSPTLLSDVPVKVTGLITYNFVR